MAFISSTLTSQYLRFAIRHHSKVNIKKLNNPIKSHIIQQKALNLFIIMGWLVLFGQPKFYREGLLPYYIVWV